MAKNTATVQIQRPWRFSKRRGTLARLGLALVSACLLLMPSFSLADSAAEINRDADAALQKLYRTTPAAKKLSGIAKGILVFPQIIQGGLIVGGQYGEGVLRVGGRNAGYYNTVAASWGLQIGAESFGYALFFLDQDDLNYLQKSDGWEIGAGPTVTVADEGIAAKISTTSSRSGIYAFFFNQKGLMAGIKLEGSKITRINPGR